MLVLDLADDLLDQILDRGQAVGAAVLIDHDRHVYPGIAHLQKKIENPHRGRHEQRFAHDPLEREVRAVAPIRQKVLDVDHADHLVEVLAEDRQTGMHGVAHRADDLGEARLDADRFDVGARHHDVPDLQLAETQRIEQQLPLALGEFGAVGRRLLFVLLDQLFEGLAQRTLAVAASREHPQSGQQAVQKRSLSLAPFRGQLLHDPASSGQASAESGRASA